MGAADIVPGVSGGTIAFITGIYDRLLDSIRSFDMECLKRLLRGDFKGIWQHVDGGFLLALLLGIATSILTLARVIFWLLTNYPVQLWAFFFGLVLASALVLLRQIDRWTPVHALCLVAGIGAALGVALSPVVAMNFGLGAVFLSGFLAICAMILPGISGSFILVLLGMYSTVLTALKNFDMLFIAVFAVGAAAGLMSFSRFLHWLLHRVHTQTMAVLTGFLFGSLAVVWPWKHVIAWVEGSHGQLKPAQQLPVLPSQYQELTGQDPAIVVCVVLMFVGFFAVWFIDSRWGDSSVRS
ncbi:MAG: putative membrane protein [Halioglobus sp.]|jgi:putative membrane protein